MREKKSDLKSNFHNPRSVYYLNLERATSKGTVIGVFVFHCVNLRIRCEYKMFMNVLVPSESVSVSNGILQI